MSADHTFSTMCCSDEQTLAGEFATRRPRSKVIAAMNRLIVEEAGQDLVEYALLSAFIGCAGAALFSVIAESMGTAYSNWDDTTGGIQTPSVVEMPDPQ